VTGLWRRNLCCPAVALPACRHLYRGWPESAIRRMRSDRCARATMGHAGSRCTNAALYAMLSAAVVPPINPIVGSLANGCALATMGIAAAPPSPAMNSRRRIFISRADR
jgi:hypothetical protein